MCVVTSLFVDVSIKAYKIGSQASLAQARPGQARRLRKRNIETLRERRPELSAPGSLPITDISVSPSLFICPCTETSEIKLVAASLQIAVNTACQGRLGPLSVKPSWVFFRTGYHLFKYCASLWKAATVQRLPLQGIALPVIGSISSSLLPGNVKDM